MTNKPLEAKHEQDSLFGRAVAHVDQLVEQGKPLSEALDHAAQRFGADRRSLSDFIADRNPFVRNSDLGTVFGSVSTRSSAVSL